MNTSAKVLATIGAIFIYLVVATIIIAAMKEAGSSTGFVGLILLVALIGAIKAIWKKPEQDIGKNKKNNNTSILQN